MKHLLAILIAFSVLQITPALAGLNRTDSRFTLDVNWAIKRLEAAKGTQTLDVLKVKNIKKDFDTFFKERAKKIPRHEFYKYAKEQYKSINKVLEIYNVPTLTRPNWIP